MTITVPRRLREELEGLKLRRSEPLYEVVLRLVAPARRAGGDGRGDV